MFFIALTTALEKGAEDTVELIVKARLAVANMNLELVCVDWRI